MGQASGYGAPSVEMTSGQAVQILKELASKGPGSRNELETAIAHLHQGNEPLFRKVVPEMRGYENVEDYLRSRELVDPRTNQPKWLLEQHHIRP